MNRQLDCPIKRENALTDWIKATEDFYLSYTQLATYIPQDATQEKVSAEESSYIGQCPMAPIVSLLTTMHTELERLFQDMGPSKTLQQVTISENYRKLAAHTLVLKRLNQQAKIRLLLITSMTQ
ncbi:hypothetical protein [Spirosoma spitsbergense]|uniref:hypothetical protein n=1 Tax=Spirosoma spitsbergense TaxID=431554 RepID=UPI00035EFB66|nr:hypothetical protein [Spirosoma spitsbergense]